MDPKYSKSTKDDWDYAGEPDLEWHTWKEHGNDKGQKSEFTYRDETPESISETKEFPETGYQENPDKEWD